MAAKSLVHQLLDEIADCGRTPEEVCGAYPELLPEVRRLWRQMRAVEAELDALFPVPGHGPDADSDPSGQAGADVPRISGYDVEALLGRGGMGVVYKARHHRLNRPVALKMLIAGAYAGPTERARFQHEAEAVASLRHANIVAVYDVGDHEGCPYFSMELLEGGSLAQALAGTPQPARQAAALLIALAEAVQAAHRAGIVHRDLKPANILLTADGTLKVADFGLARPFEGEPSLTLSGARVGTPSYMAPEQARGQARAIGPAADVYSLGAILYETLTGRPPFRAETPSETVQQVIDQDPAPPSRLNARVPRDLETMCLKCLEKDPHRRYATARALAEDLRAWLEGRPMAARRVGAAERAWLWCRRRPAIAALAAAVVLSVVGGTATTIAVQAAANRALGRKNNELVETLGREAAANRRVEQRYELAVEASRTFHTGVSEDFLLKQDQFQGLRDRLLKSAADFYGKLSALLERETGAASRRALLASRYELAELTGRVGRREDALVAHRAVLAAREALAAEPGADAAETTAVGRSLAAVASLLELTGKTDEALAAYRRAESLLAGPAGSDPAARAALATCRARLGYLLGDTGAVAAARAAHEAALADRRALAAARPDDIKAAVGLAGSLDLFGHFQEKTGRTAEALTSFQEGRAVMERAAAAEPGVASHRLLLAHLMTHVGFLLSTTGNPSGAEGEYRRAPAIREKLAADLPAVTDFRSHLAGTYHNLAMVLAATGQAPEAEAEYRRAVAISGRLTEESPAVTEHRLFLANHHNALGILLSQTGRPAEAEGEYRRALAIQEKLAADYPAVTDFRERLAGSHNNLGSLLVQRRRLTEAEAEYLQGLEIREKLAADNPKVPGYRDGLASSHTDLSCILRRLDRPAEARDGCDQAIAIREALIKEVPKVPMYRSHLAWSYRHRGLARRDMGELASAAADARRALALREGLPSRSGEEWFETACARAALAGLAGGDDSGVSAAEAASAAETAIALLHQAVAMGYRSLDAFRTEDALDPLRARPDFRLLLDDLAFPADPFAPAGPARPD